jgi:hypothetical protein
MTVSISGATVSGGVNFGSIPAFTYYRWQITKIRGGGGDGYDQAAEFVFQLDGVDQTAITGGATVSNPGGASPGGEGPGNLIDNNLTTKWLDLNFPANGYSDYIFQFAIPQRFTGYRWATANDATWRDPASWTIAVSNNGTTWITINTITNYVATESRNTFNSAINF